MQQPRPWLPEGIDRTARASRPTVGDVVAYDRRAWDVTHVADATPTSDEQGRLNAYLPEHRHDRAPYVVTLRRRHGAPHPHENERHEIGLRIRANAFRALPRYLHERVPLCSCHQEPWPCLEADLHDQAEKEALAAEKELALLPGCCPACQEPVTARQRTITFPGEYLRNPLAPPNPTFHLRRACYSTARRYENAWVAVDPAHRLRSLLTLTCPGTVIVHGDGSAECFGAPESVCPTVHAHHRAMTACVAQAHGCGRGCVIDGHPGIRVADRPSDPRDFRPPAAWSSGATAPAPHTDQP